MLGQEHGEAFVVAYPTSVAVTAVGQVGRKQRVEMIVRELALERFEANFLEHDVAVRIGENFLMNPVAAAILSVGQFKSRDAGLEGLVLKGAVPLFLGKEVAPIGYHETEIASAGLIDTRKINFV